jgi:CheY-like chemotaxis protein
MQRLMHPHVVRILEADSEDAGYSFYVMEYLDGGTFENAILAGKLARDQIRGIVLQIGVALAKAHEINMVHRDVTPENILLSQDTTAKLTDFDLVRIADSTGGTKTGALGKFIYTPPECMYFAKAADPRCDIFSLGMTAIFAFYGERLPVTAFANSPAFLASLQLPQPLKQVLARAVDHEPERRHSTMIAFCDAFANAFEKQTTGSKTRILVVDDSATDRLLMAGLLERHGFATILARDGLEAIEQIRCEEPDAVVTDLQIPSMNGLEVISQLREQFPRIPVILTTALGSEEIVVQAFQMGAASYVGKRQIAAELAATVESVLGGSRARWEGDVPRSK